MPSSVPPVTYRMEDAFNIIYSSGTTGVPKCIVHCAGGALLQHIKEHRLHGDVKPGDRLFYFTTCGWMMWNWLVSGLASGATVAERPLDPALYPGVAPADLLPGALVHDAVDQHPRRLAGGKPEHIHMRHDAGHGTGKAAAQTNIGNHGKGTTQTRHIEAF
mgnify:CR=1 FL=1